MSLLALKVPKEKLHVLRKSIIIHHFSH